MCNDRANYKRIAFCFVTAIVLIFSLLSNCYMQTNVAFAEKSEIEQELEDATQKSLDDIDSSELDEYVLDMGDYDLNILNFKDFVKMVLSGELISDYNSIFENIKQKVISYFKSIVELMLIFLVLVLLYKTFNSFCSQKYEEIKKVVKLIFLIVIVLLLLIIFKDLSLSVKNTIQKIFNFSTALFPILLNLMLVANAGTSYGCFSTLSVFLLETGSYLFVYVLFPLSVSIMVLGLAGMVMSKKNLSRVSDLLKSIFKYIIVGFMFVFGIFSSMNILISGMKDGLSLRLTKYAIKNYVPVLGGYISDGFDVVRSCSVMIKNSFGICGIFVLLTLILSPLISYICYIIAFKLLAICVSFLGEDHFALAFENVSKSISYFVSVLVGVFCIMLVFVYMTIVSVTVIWWFMV